MEWSGVMSGAVRTIFSSLVLEYMMLVLARAKKTCTRAYQTYAQKYLLVLQLPSTQELQTSLGILWALSALPLHFLCTLLHIQ